MRRPGSPAWRSAPLGLKTVVAQVMKSEAAGKFFECLDMIHGPPPTWPVVTGVSLFHCSGIAAVICPAGMCSVWSNTPCAYQAGPGIMSTLSSAPPYFLAKSGVNTLSGGTVPFLINGSSKLAISVQWLSVELINSLPPSGAAAAGTGRPRGRSSGRRTRRLVADDVAGVLGGDLLAERRPLLPRRGRGVAELVHQLLVDPEHHRREVVLDADLRTVDRALCRRCRRPLARDVAEMWPVSGSAKLNGFCDIQIGSLTCSLKMTSGQPRRSGSTSWILVCRDVAPLPSPSKVTILRFTPGCATP